jgi:glycosyltransferase involved in cell wall biosynthesis
MKNCALIPAYNEEKTISEVVKKVKRTGFLPIVIDDNSTDRTFELAKKSGAVAIQQGSTTGKGEAIKAGINYVFEKMPDVENFIFIDADMQYDPEDAAALLEPLKNKDADLVMGFRDWSTVPFRHRLGNFVWCTSFNVLFGTNLKDTNCGFMSMSKDAAKILKSALYGGYIIENAILSRAVKSNLKIGQVPVKVTYNHKSEVKRGVRMVGGIFLFIVREGIKYRLGK